VYNSDRSVLGSSSSLKMFISSKAISCFLHRSGVLGLDDLDSGGPEQNMPTLRREIWVSSCKFHQLVSFISMKAGFRNWLSPEKFLYFVPLFPIMF
jgi:hypothetical protein